MNGKKQFFWQKQKHKKGKKLQKKKYILEN